MRLVQKEEGPGGRRTEVEGGYDGMMLDGVGRGVRK